MNANADTFEDIDAYISGFPEAVRTILQKIRATIRGAAPGAEEAIRYQLPTFRLNGSNLVHFAAFERHIGFYPTPSGISNFSEKLSAYKSAKGSVQFPLDQPIPYDLIAEITAFRVREIDANAAARKKR